MSGGRQVDGLQRGLAGVRDDEARLPSEQALDGEVLSDRRREAVTGLRKVIGERPDGYTAEEWRVVLAILAPDEQAAATGPGKAPTRQQAAVSRALACFPGLPAPAALQAYRRASTLPHVQSIVADVRALEGIDVLAHRDMVRARLMQVAALADDLVIDDGGEPLRMGRVDPSGAAKLGLAVVAACKGLMDLDALKAPAPLSEDPDGKPGAKPGDVDPGEALKALLRRAHADLESRRPLVLPGVDAAC
jgi:hypothetical protein